MSLTNDQRVEILQQAVRTQCRSFVEYIGESAPPYNLDENEAAKEAFEAMIAERRVMADSLVELTESLDAYADLTVSFNPRFTFFNYVSTKFALGVLKKELTYELEVITKLGETAADDGAIGPAMAEVAAQAKRHLARVEILLVDEEPEPEAKEEEATPAS
ncbi:MAG: hypothetical protein ACYTFT_10025 [Planctomycetota bacterium]|jgi:hypothetical protein